MVDKSRYLTLDRTAQQDSELHVVTLRGELEAGWSLEWSQALL